MDEEARAAGQAPEATATEDDLVTLRQQLAEEREKAERYLGQWQRAAADLQNYKRRTEQERADAAKYAEFPLMLHLLPIADDLQRALDKVSVHLAGLTWVQGIELIYRKLQHTLEAHGLTEVKAAGESFDPNLHEAVMTADGEEGKVIEELQKGYRLHDRVIRPAMVVVGRGKEKALEDSQQDAPSPDAAEGGG